MAKDHRVLKALFEDRDPKQAIDIPLKGQQSRNEMPRHHRRSVPP
jgi:hypothetical protein